jgi:hypothetical protein
MDHHTFKPRMRVTPSLPQRGRQPKGCIPLTPPFSNNPIKKGIFFLTLSRISIFLIPQDSDAKILKKPPCPAVPLRGPESGNPHG